MKPPVFSTDISKYIWETRYRCRTPGADPDRSVTDTWRRIARALSQVEATQRAAWERRFYSVLEGFKFVPGGRIQAGAGTGAHVTLFNCFVMGTIEDSTDGIFGALKEAALTMQRGGGVGCDFSTLRPTGSNTRTVGAVASGPVSFMRVWDAMCSTLLSTGNRRGAMMATLRCDHPDIEDFIDAKRDPTQLRNFNLSVLVTDAFMRAVERNDRWALVFPHREPGAAAQGTPAERDIHRHVSARDLWRRLMRAAYDYAEPGVLFIDRINRLNNLWYSETIAATNPCGEIPLPPYGACDLGSINLTQFISGPFSPQARFDMDGFRATAATATRMLDNVIDISEYPLPQQAERARASRRIGLGITGLADALLMLGLRYGDEPSLRFAGALLKELCHTAYRTSCELAREKRPFPSLDPEQHCRGEFIRGLPGDIRGAILNSGIRNSHLTALAPAGTISLFANNVSSGLEPVFDSSYTRRVLENGGRAREFELVDYACSLWWSLNGRDAPLPSHFVDARHVDPARHLKMQAALQPFVDNAVSKTINVPCDYDFEDFRTLYRTAYREGLKGCTTFRPNPITGEILTAFDEARQTYHCCSINREAD